MEKINVELTAEMPVTYYARKYLTVGLPENISIEEAEAYFQKPGSTESLQCWMASLSEWGEDEPVDACDVVTDDIQVDFSDAPDNEAVDLVLVKDEQGKVSAKEPAAAN